MGLALRSLRSIYLLLVLSALIFLSVIPDVQAQWVRIQTDSSVYTVGDPVGIMITVSDPADVTIIIITPAGTVSRNIGTVLPGVSYTGTITGVTTVPGSYTIRAEALMGGIMVVDSTSFTVVAGGGGGFDFSLSLSPAALTVEQGETAHFRILLTYSSPAWSGTVVTIQVTGLGPGMRYSSTMAGDLNIYTSSTTPTGTYTITVIGTARGVTHQASALLTVVPKGAGATPTPGFDFSVSISPSSQTVRIGDKASYSITVSLVSGAASSVSLSLSGLPSDLTYSFSPQSGTPTFSSTLTVDASAAPSTGTYTFTVTAQGGGVSKTATATLIVEEAPDFMVSASPSSSSVKQSEETSFNVAINPVGGFDKPVTLAVSGLPVGASSMFTVPSGKPPFTSTLIVETASETPKGVYSLTIDATGGDKTHSATVTLIVEEKPRQKSSLTISAASKGGKVTVSGSLSPPVEGAEVTLTYHGPNGEVITRKAIVSPDGTFRDVYSPESPGEWTVTASWSGNDEYLATASQGESFTIQRGFDISTFVSNPTNLLLIIVALAAIATIAIVARKRGGPPPQLRPVMTACPNCGATVKPEDTFCPNCGKALKR